MSSNNGKLPTVFDHPQCAQTLARIKDLTAQLAVLKPQAKAAKEQAAKLAENLGVTEASAAPDWPKITEAEEQAKELSRRQELLEQALAEAKADLVPLLYEARTGIVKAANARYREQVWGLARQAIQVLEKAVETASAIRRECVDAMTVPGMVRTAKPAPPVPFFAARIPIERLKDSLKAVDRQG